MDEEVVTVANCSSSDTGAIDVIVDITLNQPADSYRVRYSNKSVFHSPAPVQRRPAGSVSIREADGSLGSGPVNSIRVSLAPLEVQVLGR